MKKYKYELHCHTSDVSHCGRVPARTVVKNYISLGYDGLVVTDHFSRRSIGLLENASWQEKIDFFLSGYEAAIDEASKSEKEFQVLFGMELRLDCDADNDYLVYGINEAFLRNAEGLLQMDFEHASEYLHQNGMFIAQAHPFRMDMCIADWNLLDGMEVFNASSSHESNNSIADAWADLHHLIKTSGSDYHGVFTDIKGGIATDKPIHTNDDLIATLRSGQYDLLR